VDTGHLDRYHRRQEGDVETTARKRRAAARITAVEADVLATSTLEAVPGLVEHLGLDVEQLDSPPAGPVGARCPATSPA
jgi:hypothetical protein